MIGLRGFAALRRSDFRSVLAGAAVYIILTIAVRAFDKEVLTNTRLANLSFLFIGIYAVGIVLLMRSGKRVRRAVCCILMLAVCIELGINGYATMSGLNKEHNFKLRSEYSEKVGKISNAVDYVTENDTGLFRMESTNGAKRTENDGMSFGFNGMSHYSSTYNRKIVDFNRKMGMLQESVLIRYYGSTLITDSLLDVKYIISDKAINDNYEEYYSNDKVKVYENPTAVGYGIAAKRSALADGAYGSVYMENQNVFARSLMGRSYVRQQTARANGNTLSFVATGGGSYYVEMPEKYDGDIGIVRNNIKSAYSYDDTVKKIFYIGDLNNYDSVRLTFKSASAAEKAKIYRVDNDRFIRDCTELRENNLKIAKRGRTWLEGTITLKQDEMLFTSIPYEEGWTAYVDGQEAEIKCAQNAFLAVDPGEGGHCIRLEYHTPGFAQSAAVSTAALALTLIFAFRKKLLKLIKNKRIIKKQ